MRSPEWWQERAEAFSAACARCVEERVGRDRIRSVILCGSFASGDESIVLETEPPLLLSDVDLAVILDSLDELVRWRPRRAELRDACEALLPEVRFVGRVDVGLMLERDLAALPARPGVLDMRSAGRLLAGDAGSIEAIPRHGPSDIPAREAVILIENRIASILGCAGGPAGAGGDGWYRFQYEIAKAYTDIGAAALSLAGAYREGYAARARILADAVRDGAPAGSFIDEALASRIAAWTRFKTAPSRESVPREARDEDIAGVWEDSARDIERFWRRAAAFAAAGPDGLRRPPAESVLSRAGRRPGGTRDRWRSWREYLAGRGRCALGIAASRGPVILASFPDDVVREHAVKLLLHRLHRGADAPLKPPAGGFPYRAASWPLAAGELNRVWREIVFGSEGRRA